MKSVIIIGAGFAGILAAINIKKNSSKTDVLVIEHTDKPLKKVLSTGNGKCNLGNSKLDLNKFSNSDFVKKVYKLPSIQKQQAFFKGLGIETKLIDNLLYPITESTVTVRNALLSHCDRLGIKINVLETLMDYKVDSEILVKTDKAEYKADKLIFACGGKSLPISGSDGTIFPLLEKHKYSIVPMGSGLCPITTIENTKIMSGTRVKACASLYKNHRLVYKESGEVLFKDHGLSGIVIMNLSRIIAKDPSKYTIELDLLESYKDNQIADYISENGKDAFLNAFLHPNIIKYFEKNKIKPSFAKRLSFTCKQLLGYEFSQVTVGGISLKNVKPTLESTIEKNVFFVGEILDIDGPCGGYNLTWAYASALLMK